jgi:hypothetical protein
MDDRGRRKLAMRIRRDERQKPLILDCDLIYHMTLPGSTTGSSVGQRTLDVLEVQRCGSQQRVVDEDTLVDLEPGCQMARPLFSFESLALHGSADGSSVLASLR